jgi:peptide subunit release factor 1 (eRF1)
MFASVPSASLQLPTNTSSSPCSSIMQVTSTTGWAQTLEAASDGRAELLLVQDGVDEPAYQCPACGRAQTTNGSCPLDGTTLESRESGLDLAVHQTLVYGGTVHVIRERRDLEPVGGVAALLRF